MPGIGIIEQSGLIASEFKSEESSIDHYLNPRSEFGNITKEEYLLEAPKLVNSKPGGNILTKVCSNGDTIFYNNTTNEFAVKSIRGSIRTYFKPKDGINYFLKQ